MVAYVCVCVCVCIFVARPTKRFKKLSHALPRLCIHSRRLNLPYLKPVCVCVFVCVFNMINNK